MTTLIDPSTSTPLPPDSIQRILFISASVHIYAIPPLTSMKGYTAADWTTPDPRNGGKTKQIFTARLRVLETAIPTQDQNGEEGEKVKTDILLEDPASGDLFAAAPYTSASAVEHVLDSSRFFVVRVVGEGGRKAMLGIGFEERGEAFDFSVVLQEVRKVLGFEEGAAGVGQGQKGAGRRGAKTGGNGETKKSAPPQPVKDYSLKPGETIRVDIGPRGKHLNTARDEDDARSPATAAREDEMALFSIAPPPYSGSSALSFSSSGSGGGAGEGGSSEDGIPRLGAPPGPGGGGRRRRPQSGILLQEREKQKLKEESLGFDDGEFGEFQ